jgi:arginyl-tRNA synthetase
MTFNPQESIDLNGNTGPFIQYTHARIQSVLRKATEKGVDMRFEGSLALHAREKILIKRLYNFPNIVNQAAETYSPALIANYVYELVKEYNQFYHDVPILKTEDQNLLGMRLQLSAFTAKIIRKAMDLLGVQVPDKM